MKIVQINAVYNIGSTGRTTAEMHEALQNAGHQSFVVYSQTNVNNVENTYCMGSPLDIKIHGFLSRLSGKQGYFSVNSTKKLLKLLDEINKFSPSEIICNDAFYMSGFDVDDLILNLLGMTLGFIGYHIFRKKK